MKPVGRSGRLRWRIRTRSRRVTLRQGRPRDGSVRRCRSIVLAPAEGVWVLLSFFVPDLKHSPRSWYVRGASFGATRVSRKRRCGKEFERAGSLWDQDAARPRGLECALPEPGKPCFSLRSPQKDHSITARPCSSEAPCRVRDSRHSPFRFAEAVAFVPVQWERRPQKLPQAELNETLRTEWSPAERSGSESGRIRGRLRLRQGQRPRR